MKVYFTPIYAVDWKKVNWSTGKKQTDPEVHFLDHTIVTGGVQDSIYYLGLNGVQSINNFLYFGFGVPYL